MTYVAGHVFFKLSGKTTSSPFSKKCSKTIPEKLKSSNYK